MTSHRLVTTPVGRLHLAATAQGLSHAAWLSRDHGRPPGDGSAAAAQIVDNAHRQIDSYFDDPTGGFKLPLDLSGTELQRSIWHALDEITRGHTTTYAEIAARIGRPRASRAVGMAVGANPVSIILPCHRVIGSDGRLRGYAGGLDAKAWLLAHEGVTLPLASI